MHVDHAPYLRFSTRSSLDKAINSLLGITEGITADSKINAAEAAFLRAWLQEHQGLRQTHPYNELMPVVERSIADGVLDAEEKEDIRWLCERLQSHEFYDTITASMQRLHAILGGVASDGLITGAELDGVSEWLEEHNYLHRIWPYDEVSSLITGVLQDKTIALEEHELLMRFFGEFTALLDDRTVTNPVQLEGDTIVGLCAVCPEIDFQEKSFCITGASYKYRRSEFTRVLEDLGAKVINNVSKKLDYLIIGAEGNPCWAYACYGRKVEAAMTFRREGAQLLLVHENDLHDAISDL